MNVRDTTTGFFYQDHAAGMIPDLFLIVPARGQPEIDIGISPGHGEVFALAVNSEWLSCDVQNRSNFA